MRMMDDNYTNTLEEKIYFGTTKNTKGEINKTLNDFFSHLLSRRRNDPIEGGLQASLVCLPNSFAAKVCEDDGLQPHMANEYNLYKFLNNSNQYITTQGIRFFMLVKNELYAIEREGFYIRILNGEDKLMMVVFSKNDIVSPLQTYILKVIANYCKQMLEKKYYQDIEIAIRSNNINVNFDYYDGKFDDIIEQLSNVNNNRLSQK